MELGHAIMNGRVVDVSAATGSQRTPRECLADRNQQVPIGILKMKVD